VSLKQQALDAAEKADFYQVRYEAAREGLPPTPVEPHEIKTAVDAVGKLRHYKSSPLALMLALSKPLGAYPQTQLDRIQWRSSLDPSDSVEIQDRRRREENVTTIEKSALYSHYNIAVIDAHLIDFNGNYREAIDLVESFADRLRDQPNVHAIEIVNYPLDVESGASLAGLATDGNESPEAFFSLKVVLGIPDGGKET
ncbi:MAG: hypothetical protein AAF387_00510, partial [Pseudomonadota bacterium]